MVPLAPVAQQPQTSGATNAAGCRRRTGRPLGGAAAGGLLVLLLASKVIAAQAARLPAVEELAEGEEANGRPWGTASQAVRDFDHMENGRSRQGDSADEEEKPVQMPGQGLAVRSPRDALLNRSTVLANFESKARSPAPSDFLSSLSEVFRSVKDVKELAAMKSGSTLGQRVLPLFRKLLSKSKGTYGLVAHDSAARRSASGGWVVPVQAWIYRHNEARHKMRMALCRKLLVEMYHGIRDMDEEAARRYEERGRLIFRTLVFRGGVRGKELEVRFEGEEAWRPMPLTGKDGRVKTEIPLDESFAKHVAKGADQGRPSIGFQVRVAGKAAEEVTASAEALLWEREGALVISDIDDTVKVTEVYRGADMVLRKTFLEEFRAVAGMVPLYRSWEREAKADFAFVSNSPPELLEPLRDFFNESGFPKAPIYLRPLKGSRREWRSFKQRSIEELLAQFPEKRVILVGDSGERDAAMSAELLRKHPDQVAKALIRQVHPDKPVDVSVFSGLPAEKWQAFSDPKDAFLPAALG